MLCLTEVVLASNSTSHCKEKYAPKWKETRSLYTSLIALDSWKK